MVTKKSVVQIQNLIVNHESRPNKSNSGIIQLKESHKPFQLIGSTK